MPHGLYPSRDGTAPLRLRPRRRRGQRARPRDEPDRRHLDDPRRRQPRHGRGLRRRHGCCGCRAATTAWSTGSTPAAAGWWRGSRSAGSPHGSPSGRSPGATRSATPGTCDEAGVGLAMLLRAPLVAGAAARLGRVAGAGSRPRLGQRRHRSPPTTVRLRPSVAPTAWRASRSARWRLPFAVGPRRPSSRSARPRAGRRRSAGGRPVHRRVGAHRLWRAAARRRLPPLAVPVHDVAGGLAGDVPASSAAATPPSRTSSRAWPARLARRRSPPHDPLRPERRASGGRSRW